MRSRAPDGQPGIDRHLAHWATARWDDASRSRHAQGALALELELNVPIVHRSPTTALRSVQRRDLDIAHAAHVVLAVAFVTWRVLEATPATSSRAGATFATSDVGRALTLACIALGLTALAAVVVATWRRRYDLRLLGLLVALVGAIWQRGDVDALDVAYVLLVALLTSLWFGAQRAAASARE